MKQLYTLFAALTFGVSVHAQNTIYVNASATGNNDGTSWTDAFTDLNDATNSATSGDSIFIAEGTYYPDINGGLSYPAFVLAPNVNLLGGFPNTGNPTMQDRDWETYLTICDGDLNGDDDNTAPTRSDNAKRIFITDTDFLMDGLIIQNGGDDAGSPGAGIAMSGATERNGTVRNCMFRLNWVTNAGGPVSEGGAIRASAATEDDELIVDNCIFVNNIAMQGGAIMFGGVAHISNSRFLYNIGGRGSAIQAYQPVGTTVYTDSDITNCVFYKNICLELGLAGVASGGTIQRYKDRLGLLTIANCTFKDNESYQTNVNDRSNIFSNYETVDYNATYFDNCLFDVNGDRNFKSGNNCDLYFRNCVHNGNLTGFYDVSQSTTTNTSFGNFTYSVNDTLTGIFVLDCASDGIDAGDNSLITGFSEDLLGNSRISGTSVDVGAFETQQSFNFTATVNAGTVTLDQTALSYQWIDCNNGNQPIAGATSQSFTPAQTGSYACAADFGCGMDTTACSYVEVVGLELLSNESLTVYPNPVHDVLHISSNAPVQSIRLQTISGDLVALPKASSTESLDLASLENGIYIVLIETTEGMTSKKIVVLH